MIVELYLLCQKLIIRLDMYETSEVFEILIHTEVTYLSIVKYRPSDSVRDYFIGIKALNFILDSRREFAEKLLELTGKIHCFSTVSQLVDGIKLDHCIGIALMNNLFKEHHLPMRFKPLRAPSRT